MLAWKNWVEELGAGGNYVWCLNIVVIFMGLWGGKRWKWGRFYKVLVIIWGAVFMGKLTLLDTKEMEKCIQRERRMRQLAEKGSQYQMNLQLDKRNRSKTRLWRKVITIDYLIYSSIVIVGRGFLTLCLKTPLYCLALFFQIFVDLFCWLNVLSCHTIHVLFWLLILWILFCAWPPSRIVAFKQSLFIYSLNFIFFQNLLYGMVFKRAQLHTLSCKELVEELIKCSNIADQIT